MQHQGVVKEEINWSRLALKYIGSIGLEWNEK